MKRREEMTEKEILIRLDERMEHIQKVLPGMQKKLSRHDVAIALILAVMGLALGRFLPLITEALAKI